MTVGPSYCGFPVSLVPVDDTEYIVQTTIAADGTVVSRITGHLTPTLTSLATSQCVTLHFSGLGTLTFHQDGSYSLV